jgi:hypothetical protein
VPASTIDKSDGKARSRTNRTANESLESVADTGTRLHCSGPVSPHP